MAFNTGLGFRSLAVRTGISLFEAGEILARLRARFHRFEDYAQSVRDHAGLHLEIGTPFGWWMQCPSGMNPRTIRNFPIQSTGSEILHVACVLAERRGIEIVAPVHDAIMAEGPADQAEELSAALDQVMGDAAAVVLRGYRLPTDCQIIRPGERYFDDRGEAMWTTVTRTAGQAESGRRRDGYRSRPVRGRRERPAVADGRVAGQCAAETGRRVTSRFRWRGWRGCCRWFAHTTHLVVAMLLYRECLLRRSNTVALSNGELRKLGISRYAKYRALAWLRGAGVIAIEEARNRRSVRVTLLWFP